MSEVKHTPGKWVACGSEDTLATWVEDDAGKRVCTMRKCEQDWRRAQLIAAAPELLEALAGIVSELKPFMGQGRMDETINAARAAIAKATGKE